METGLEGRVVLITGASGGIGSAIARHFAAEGAKLVLHYRSSRANIENLVRTSKSENAISVQADLTKESQVRQIFAQVLKRFGRVDTLIANAGSWESHDVPLYKMSLRQWEDTFDNVLSCASGGHCKRSRFLCIGSFGGSYHRPNRRHCRGYGRPAALAY